MVVWDGVLGQGWGQVVEGGMSETERVLKPANENPWYVLITLSGRSGSLTGCLAIFERDNL